LDARTEFEILELAKGGVEAGRARSCMLSRVSNAPNAQLAHLISSLRNWRN